MTVPAGAVVKIDGIPVQLVDNATVLGNARNFEMTDNRSSN